MKQRLTLLLLSFMLIILPSVGMADSTSKQIQAVITLGEDLTDQQKRQVLEYFGMPEAKQIVVSNQEEREALSDLVPIEVIGDKAISSAYVIPKEAGYGIQVQTSNITWIHSKMFAQALATAGVHDAEVRVAAPFPVSGTAALTGIMKAFEAATDAALDQKQKEVATEELIVTANLAEDKGNQEKVLELMDLLKQEIAKNKLSEEQLSLLIDQLAQRVGLSLTEEEKQALVSLAMKLQGLEIDWKEVMAQGEQLLKQAEDFLQEHPETKSWIQSLWEQCKVWIDNWLSKL